MTEGCLLQGLVRFYTGSIGMVNLRVTATIIGKAVITKENFIKHFLLNKNKIQQIQGARIDTPAIQITSIIFERDMFAPTLNLQRIIHVTTPVNGYKKSHHVVHFLCRSRKTAGSESIAMSKKMPQKMMINSAKTVMQNSTQSESGVRWSSLFSFGS